MQGSRIILAMASVLSLLLTACGGSGGGSSSPGADGVSEQPLIELLQQRGLDGDPSLASDRVPPPDEDSLTHLGKVLFFSRTLSGDYDVACASCHHPVLAGGDALSLPVGVAASEPWRLGVGREIDISLDRDPNADCDSGTGFCGPNVPRNSPTTFNTGLYRSSLFFDGRLEVVGTDATGAPLLRTPETGTSATPGGDGALLVAQARLPVVSSSEMRGFGHVNVAPEAFRTLLINRLRGIEPAGLDFVTEEESTEWFSLFRDAFPNQVDSPALISFHNVQRALAAYQRSQLFIDSPWARYVKGEGEIPEAAQSGARLFFGDPEEGGLGCYRCHSGDFFSDERFHNVGFPQIGRGKRSDQSDPGRQGVTHDDRDLYAYRTPSLLNVALTAPYGHAGTFQSLEDVLVWHTDPVNGLLDSVWSELAQFVGISRQDQYPAAIAHTAATLAESNFRNDLLPMRALSGSELDALVAFLHTLTDSCAADAACVQRWVPGASDDPDGNLLLMGVPSPVDAVLVRPVPETPVEQEPPPSGDPVVFATESLPPLNGFPELQGCMPGTALNLGISRFFSQAEKLILDPSVNIFPVPEISYGPDFEHGYRKESWFGANSDVEPVMVSGGMTATYVDGDCWPDLVVAAGDPAGLRFYRNRIGWYFNRDDNALDWSGTTPLGGHVASLASADLDGDFRRELVLGNMFVTREPEGSPVVSGLSRDNMVVLSTRGDGTLYRSAAIPTYRATFGIAFADADNDGDVDFFAGHWGYGQTTGASVFFENRIGAEGRLVPSDAAWRLSHADGLERQYIFTPAFWDIDNDGWQDLAIAADYGTSTVLRNMPGASGRQFTRAVPSSVLTDENGMGGAVGDIDNDGDQDWFVTSVFDEDGVAEISSWGVTGNRLYRNDSSQGDIVFTDISDVAGVRNGAWGWGACMADFNNDGWLDIFHENGFGYIPESLRDSNTARFIDLYKQYTADFNFSLPRLFINNGRDPSGDVSFDDRTIDWGIDEPTNGRGVVCFDYDRDGDIDVATLEHSGAPRFMVNQTGRGDGARFVSVRLVGSPPNTEALGASISLTADLDGNGSIGEGESQLRAASANSNYASQNPPDLHFGLGNASVIDRIRVSWPGDGDTLECRDVPVNRFLVFDQRNKVCP